MHYSHVWTDAMHTCLMRGSCGVPISHCIVIPCAELYVLNTLSTSMRKQVCSLVCKIWAGEKGKEDTIRHICKHTINFIPKVPLTETLVLISHQHCP